MTFLDIRLAVRNVSRQGLRSSMPILVVALATYVIILVGGMYQYLFDSLDQGVVQTEGHLKIVLTKAENLRQGYPHTMTQELHTQLETLPGVLVIAVRSPLAGVVGRGEKSSIFSGVAFESEKEWLMKSWPARGIKNEEGNTFRDREINQQEKVFPSEISRFSGAHIGKGLAGVLDVSVGVWLNGISGYESFAVPVEEVVSTDSEEKDRFFLAIPYDALGGINYSTVQTVHIQLTDPELLPLVQREVEALFEREQISALFVPYNAPTGYVASVRAIYTDNLRFIMVVLAVTVFFSIAIVFNLSIAERAKELGTMRTFGMKKKHLTLLFQIEAFCLALYGYSLGSLTAFVSGVVINYYGGIRLPPPPTVYKPIVVGYAFSPPYVCISLALVVLVAQFSSFMVTRRLGTLSVIEQLTQIT